MMDSIPNATLPAWRALLGRAADSAGCGLLLFLSWQLFFRIGFLLWTLLAAAAAITRLREDPSPSSPFLAVTLPQATETAYAATP
jgi:hypothetical protein